MVLLNLQKLEVPKGWQYETDEEYHGHPFLSSSNLKDLLTKDSLISIDPNSPSLAQGTAVHQSLEKYLTDYEVDYKFFDELTPAKKFEALNSFESGKIYVDNSPLFDRETIAVEESCYVSLEDLKKHVEVLTNDRKQFAKLIVEVLEDNNLSGIKAKVDFYCLRKNRALGVIGDFKSTSEKSISGCYRAISKFEYDLSMVFYRLVIECAFPNEKVSECKLIFLPKAKEVINPIEITWAFINLADRIKDWRMRYFKKRMLKEEDSKILHLTLE